MSKLQVQHIIAALEAFLTPLALSNPNQITLLLLILILSGIVRCSIMPHGWTYTCKTQWDTCIWSKLYNVIFSCRSRKKGDNDTKIRSIHAILILGAIQAYITEFPLLVLFSYHHHHLESPSPPDKTSSHDPHHHYKMWAYHHILEICRVVGVRGYNRETFVYTNLYLFTGMETSEVV